MNDKHKRLYGRALDMLARHYLNDEPLAEGFLDQGVIYKLEAKNLRHDMEEAIFYLSAQGGAETECFLKIALEDLIA